MTKNSVGIIGCGWLGKALTSELVSQQYSVIVSTQHKEKVAALSELGAQVECFTLSNIKPTEDDFKLSLFQQSCLIIAIPPMVRQGKTDYPDKIKHIVQLAQTGNVQQLIMISSTAIYNGLTGNVDENSKLDLSTKKTEIIHQAEQQALGFQGDTIILRFSGLVGLDRHPGKFLKGGRKLSDPNATTNLIHQKDAVGLLLGLIAQPHHTNIYNASSNTHVYKRDYYEKAAQTIGYPKPEFLELEIKKNNSHELSKKIISSKIRQKLNYTFQYDDLLMWLESH